MVTIRDIALEAGVSRGTVDRVLNGRGRVKADKAERIKEIAERMGYQPNIAGRGLAASKKRLKIGFVYIDDEESPYHKVVCAGAKEYAKGLMQYGVEVIFFPFKRQPSKEQGMMGDFREKLGRPEIDGWAILGMMAELLTEVLTELGKEKTPVVMYNIDGECDWKLSYVGCDYMQAGRVACGLAALMTGGRGNVCIASFDPGIIPSSVLRIRGFEAEMAEKYPCMQISGKLFLGDSGEFSELSSKIIAHLEEHQEVNILYLVNPEDYRVCFELSGTPVLDRIEIITNDLVTEKQREMIRKGDIAVTICQEPEKQGRKALEILFNYLALGIKPESDWYKTELSIQIGQNI